MHANLLHDIGLCVIAATVLAFVARLLRQPLILAYIGAGLLIALAVVPAVREPSAEVKAR